LYSTQGLDFDESLDLPQSSGCQQDRAGTCKLLHSGRQMRCMAQGGIVNIEIITDGTHHDFAGVQTNSNLQAEFIRLPAIFTIPPHFLLHGQGCIAGTHGVILVGQWGAEKRHDPVTQHLVDGPFVSMNRVHHHP
jgi:hypothetical protein